MNYLRLLLLIPPAILGAVGLSKKLQEKDIGILGMPKSGKSTFAEYLATDEFPKKPPEEQTPFVTEKKSRSQFGIKLHIDKVKDCNSRRTQSMHHENQLNVLETCDIIFYLFHMNKFFTEERDTYFNEMSTEIKVYSEELKAHPKKYRSKKKIFVAIGSFNDLIKGSSDLPFDIDEKIKGLITNLKCKKKEILCKNSLVNENEAQKTREKIERYLE